MIYTIFLLCYNSKVKVEKDMKQDIIKDYQTHKTDTGSSEVQIALLTDRINRLTEHLRIHRHDYHTLRGLLKLVGQRERQLKYLSRIDPQRYRTLIARLGLRK
jgi:small subunit ribosomal protein S15